MFWQLCKQHPSLVDAAEEAEDEEMTTAMLAERDEARRKKLKETARKQLKILSGYSALEQEKLVNQGDFEMYSDEALEKRFQLRGDKQINRLLDKWWTGAFRYFDLDKSGALDKEEYAMFYTNLYKLLDEDDEIGASDREESMSDDFESDSNNDQKVQAMEFKNSVFELADTWTYSTDKTEYIKFLTKGYAVVYGELFCKSQYICIIYS